MKNFLNVFLICFLCSGCSTTIYLVRHAEKQSSSGNMMNNDPGLNSAGIARANALADTLQDKAIDAVYATPFKRTQQTAQPTATRHGLVVATYDPNAGAVLLDSLAHRQKKRFLVVGHSNTIPGMIRALGLSTSMEDIPEDDYDNLFVVRIHWFFGRSIRLEEKTYGVASP